MAGMLDQISATEIAEWEMYYELEPFGAEYANMTVATQTSLIASFVRRRSTTAKDWLPKLERAKPAAPQGGGVLSKFQALLTAMPSIFRRVK